MAHFAPETFYRGLGHQVITPAFSLILLSAILALALIAVVAVARLRREPG